MVHGIEDPEVADVAREWLVSLGRRLGEERLAHLFCELFHRLEIVGLTEGTGFELPLTQMELADVAGLTVVHVNRTLRTLRERGLLTWTEGRVHIASLARLCSFADFQSDYLHLQGPPTRRP